MNFDIGSAIAIVNNVSLAIMLALMGAAIASMVRRALDYIRIGEPMPVILKRGFVLLGVFMVLGIETAILRAAGVTLEEDSIERLAFILQSNALFIFALGYYTKTEVFDLDDPDVK